MKKTVLAVTLVSGLLLLSCGNKDKQQEARVGEEKVENIVESAVSDKHGKTMNLLFDNERGAATIQLDGETITLLRDTAASGVRMHNDKYVYEEWQGHITLKKDGEVIFDNQK